MRSSPFTDKQVFVTFHLDENQINLGLILTSYQLSFNYKPWGREAGREGGERTKEKETRFIENEGKESK